jgi:hypothetical protein
MFEHLGRVSSLRAETQSFYPLCYVPLKAPYIWETEAFDEAGCAGDDVSPCALPPGTSAPPLARMVCCPVGAEWPDWAHAHIT